MEARVARLYLDMSEVKGLLNNRILPLLHRIYERLNHNVSKADFANLSAELAERPTRSYLWMVVGVMVATVLAAAIGGTTLVGLLK